MLALTSPWAVIHKHLLFFSLLATVLYFVEIKGQNKITVTWFMFF